MVSPLSVLILKSQGPCGWACPITKVTPPSSHFHFRYISHSSNIFTCTHKHTHTHTHTHTCTHTHTPATHSETPPGPLLSPEPGRQAELSLSCDSQNRTGCLQTPGRREPDRLSQAVNRLLLPSGAT